MTNASFILSCALILIRFAKYEVLPNVRYYMKDSVNRCFIIVSSCLKIIKYLLRPIIIAL
jgi:hypothetical protein